MFRIDRAVQLDNPIRCFDIDLQGFQSCFVKDCGFYLGCDGGVIDILAGAFVFCRCRASQERSYQYKASQGFHNTMQSGHDTSPLGVPEALPQ
jgi:hypothetical protein